MRMHVDSQAPAYVSGEKLVNAPAQVVWEVVSRIEEWPTWNPDVQKAALDGALAAGTGFRWQAGRAKITSRLEQVTAPTVIGWSASCPASRRGTSGGSNRVETRRSSRRRSRGTALFRAYFAHAHARCCKRLSTPVFKRSRTRPSAAWRSVGISRQRHQAGSRVQ